MDLLLLHDATFMFHIKKNKTQHNDSPTLQAAATCCHVPPNGCHVLPGLLLLRYRVEPVRGRSEVPPCRSLLLDR